ncbi:hypothetical protein DENIS_1440 [Desulfonema ishimotonii]|uniref:Uncharacterized protein n=1 Tax=Desulfonema ishimotonii TaxID=45657 RepID=A0A401FU27_9BACT|nr:hypothetical protein [Desulfonema ishimotonii]GBC60487.1 hypothetical protein DENIS_1440 [Desulfonema ishimotonii]
MKRQIAVILICILLFLWPASDSIVYGQTPEPPVVIPHGETVQEPSGLDTLKTLILSRQELEEQIRAKKRQYRSTRNKEEQAEIREILDRLEEQEAVLERNIERVATNVDVEAFQTKSDENFNWEDEIVELIEPFVHELKKMTERPRQIEKLRAQISFYENRLEMIRRAIQNIEKVSLQVEKNAQLTKELKHLKKSWENKQTIYSDQLKVTRYQLDELLRHKQSLWDSGQKLLKVFFKTRGRNLAFSLLGFVVVFFLMRVLHKSIYRYSPIHHKEKRTFLIRLSDVLYYVLTFLGATGALLAVLYLSGDWLLLSIAIIFLFGLVWTAKTGIPRFWKQIQLMLNLGAVRENERMMFNGVPWRVVSLNIYARLENPAFFPAMIRVPLQDIVQLNSRPYSKNEPWFPCNIGDWVILADGTRGEAVSQTQEMVQLILRGGSRKTYQTQDFLGLSPVNISGSFRLKIVFGFDYAHQSVITGEIPSRLTAALKQGVEKAGYGDHMIQLRVETEGAGASSLDLLVIADFRGAVAALYNVLRRLIQKIIIDACTENGWGIPFPQLTLHTVHVPDTRMADRLRQKTEK